MKKCEIPTPTESLRREPPSNEYDSISMQQSQCDSGDSSVTAGTVPECHIRDVTNGDCPHLSHHPPSTSSVNDNYSPSKPIPTISCPKHALPTRYSKNYIKFELT